MIDDLRSSMCSSWQRQDPRVRQVAVLAKLFGYGVVWPLPAYEPRHALISRLSLCLLLRTNILSHAMLLAYLA